MNSIGQQTYFDLSYSKEGVKQKMFVDLVCRRYIPHMYYTDPINTYSIFSIILPNRIYSLTNSKPAKNLERVNNNLLDRGNFKSQVPLYHFALPPDKSCSQKPAIKTWANAKPNKGKTNLLINTWANIYKRCASLVRPKENPREDSRLPLNAFSSHFVNQNKNFRWCKQLDDRWHKRS